MSPALVKMREFSSTIFKLNSVYAVELQCSTLCVYGCFFGQLFFVVEYLATQTGGATVNNIFEVILVECLVTI